MLNLPYNVGGYAARYWAGHNVERYREEHPERVPFEVDGRCIISDEQIYEHCRIARASGFPEIRRASSMLFEGPLLIVGSGLSALDFLPQIRERAAAGAPVAALKGAHDWLIENGVTPTFAVASDPQQARHDCFKLLRPEVIYLMASQMHPDTWGYMRGQRVRLWHSETDLRHRALPEWRGIPLIPGGPTTGLRAIPLFYLLGFRNQELYGFDSCCASDGTYKLDGSKMREGDALHDIWFHEEKFTTLTSLIPQVTNLMATIQPWPGLKLQAHGEGYFQSALRRGKAQGWPI